MTTEVRPRLRLSPISRVFLSVAIPLFLFYTVAPNPGTPPSGYHIDPLTNAVTGWHLGMRGTVVLDGFEEATAPEYFRNIGWFVESPRGPVSIYPPGAAALSAPFYRIANQPLQTRQMSGTNNPDVPPMELPMPSVGPANLTAKLAVAVAMGSIAAAVTTLGTPFLGAVAVGLLGGVVTPMWTVAASALWQHGPAAMWVALGLVFAAKERYLGSGLAFGAAVLTRPHLALIAAAIGTYVAWKERRLRPLVMVGLGSGAGLAALLAYNWWLWGRLTIAGGYGQSFTDNVIGAGPDSPDAVNFFSNLAGGLFDLEIGLLTVSLFLVPVLFKVIPAWRDAPNWARGAALGGVVYLLVQYKANRYSGGAGFVGYRYPLEPLTAAAPLLAHAYPHWARSLKVAPLVFWLLVALSLLMLLA